MASKKKPTYDFSAFFAEIAPAIKEGLYKPSPLWDLFNEPVPGLQIPMKTMTGKITVSQEAAQALGFGGTTWPCGCKDGYESYGATTFNCQKPGNHCYRRRQGG